MTDITQRKLADESLRIASMAFESQCGIIVTDSDKKILRINQAFSRMTDYSTEDVINQPLTLRSEQHDQSFYDSLWTSIEQSGYWQGEIWQICKNNKELPFLLNISVVTDTNEGITHYIASLTDISIQKQAEKVLYEERERLKSQLTITSDELTHNKQENTEINTAINVLLKHQQSDKTEAQRELSFEIEDTILPFLKKLKKVSAGRRQTNQLIDILETNLQNVMASFCRNTDLVTAYHRLTPVEIQVASMVRQGLATKTIAALLTISSGTVDIHRKHIRKKLEISGKAINLQSYLQSLSE